MEFNRPPCSECRSWVSWLVDFNYSCYREEREWEEEGDARFISTQVQRKKTQTHLLSTPPSREALRHSGGERRLCTSATVTLYFDVELRRDRRPGTEQNTSLGFTTPPKRPSLFTGMAETLLFLDKDTGPIARGERERQRETVLSESHAKQSLN